MFRTWLKRGSVVVGALVTLGGAVTGVVHVARAVWGSAKAAGASETTNEVRLKTVEGLIPRVDALEQGQQENRARMQRIEDSQGRAEDFARDVREDLRDLRFGVHPASGKR